MERKLRYKKINTEQEIRHEKNIIKLNLENEKISKENKERTFRKYVSFFWQRKAKEKELKNKTKDIFNKLNEKSEKLMMLEKINQKKRDNIIKKLKTWDVRKKEKERNIQLKILDNKKIREKRFSSCLERRKEILEEEFERSSYILFLQNQRFMRSLSKENSVILRRNNAHEKASQEQIILERNLNTFNKQMNILKSQSIFKKTIQERIKMFKELKKREADKKKEIEENLKKY